MRNKFLFIVAIFAMVLMFGTVSYAADKADQAQYVTYTVGLGDVSSGNCAEVDSSGNVAVKLATGTNSVGTVVLGAGTAEVGLVKISDGTDQALVDGDKNLMVEEDGNNVKYLTPTGNTKVHTGVGVLESVVFSSSTAGDTVYIYDDTDGSKDLTIYGASVGTNNDTVASGRLNINVTNGIYAIKSNTAARVTIVYDDSQT